MHLPEWNIYFLFLLSFTNIDRDISQAGFFSRRRQPTEVKIQKKTKEKKKRETQDTNKEDEEEKKTVGDERRKLNTIFTFKDGLVAVARLKAEATATIFFRFIFPFTPLFYLPLRLLLLLRLLLRLLIHRFFTVSLFSVWK